VHRDIKPANVMLRPDGFVKVLDFGLAKLTEAQALAGDADISVASETETGVVLGTLRYMSPEQARGQKVDARSDLFSLGVVLYEMVTGQLPFAGASSADVIVAILTQEPEPLAHFRPEAPEALESLVSKALCKDREKRYQTAQELLADLEQLRQSPEQEARRAGELQARRSAGSATGSRRAAVEPAAEPAVHTGTETGGLTKLGAALRIKPLIRQRRAMWVGLLAILVVVTLVAVIPWGRRSQPANPETLPRPVHWWTFDNGLDDSGTSTSPITATGGFKATKSDEVMAIVVGRLAGSCSRTGNAVHLKGVEEAFINFGPGVGQFGKRDFSVAFWFATSTPELKSEILSNRLDRDANNFFGLRLMDNPAFPGKRLNLELIQDDKGHNYLKLYSQPGLDDGKWHHFVAWRQGTKGALFIDGASIQVAETVNRLGDGITDLNNGQPLMLGSSPFLESPAVVKKYDMRRFQGMIDELQIYDRALSDREIHALFTSGQDADGDGICDNLDRCPQSDRRPTVAFGGCQTNVVNYLPPAGCTLNDLLADCAATAKTRTQFSSCVESLTSELIKAATITVPEQESLKRCAASASLQGER
jgi:hypothetical protein